MSNIGARMVVNFTGMCCAIGISSFPMTDTVSGTSIPRSWRAVIVAWSCWSALALLPAGNDG
jgi:hypothetical protein